MNNPKRTPTLSDAQRVRPYAGRKLRKVLCAPLDSLTDDYLREHNLAVEAIFLPIPGLTLDEQAKANSLIVVVKKGQKEIQHA